MNNRYQYFKLSVSLAILAILPKGVMAQNNQLLQPVAYFMYNKLLYNPASAGTGSSQFNAGLMTRLQWADINGAPVTNFFWTDFKIPAYKMAVGLNVFSDRIGVNTYTDIMLNYSYYINITDKLKLSMGLRAGVTNSQYTPRDLVAWQLADPKLDNSINANLPKFGAGFQLYNNKMFVSFSTPDLAVIDNSDALKENNLGFFNRSRNYMLMAGYRIKLGDLYGFNPNISASYHKSSGTRFDINTLFEITDYFWAGGTYSISSNANNTTSNAILMAGTNISSRIKFGYAYEFNLSGTSNSARLYTHEINLILTFDNLFKKKAE